MAEGLRVETVPRPLHFLLVADRARLAVAHFRRLGKVNERDKEALLRGQDLLQKVFEAGKLVETRSMAGFSAEAADARMIALRAAQQVPSKPITTNSCLGVVEQVKNTGVALCSEGPVSQDDAELAVTFWTFLSDLSLAKMGTPIERLTRHAGA